MISCLVKIQKLFYNQISFISSIYYVKNISGFEVLHNRFYDFRVLTGEIFSKTAYNKHNKDDN